MNYEKQEKELFDLYNDMNLLPLPKNSKYFVNDKGIELIIRPQCDQKCSYCYITQHGKDLYPNILSKEEILQNIDLVLDYVYNTRKNVPLEIEIFGGELFSDNLFFDTLDLIIKYLKEVKEKEPLIFKKRFLISLPSNLNWVYNYPEKVNKWREYHNLLDKEYNTFLSTSWSTDGYYAINSREKKNLDENYFNVIFNFCKEFYYGYHPMIAPENIETWCENYDWWLSKYKEYELTFPGYFQPYLLMVRNGNWTEQKINSYCNLLAHIMERRLEMCDNSKEKLAYHLLVGDPKEGQFEMAHGSDPISLADDHTSPISEGLGCSAQDLVHFNISNLSLSFCHRLTYPQFTPIYFITNEEKTKIIDYKINNIGGYITLKTFKAENLPLCSKCKIKSVCRMGCLGAQFENSGEIFMPITSLCNFFKKTNDFLVDLYYKYGIIEVGKEKGWIYQRGHSYLLNTAYEKGYLK